MDKAQLAEIIVKKMMEIAGVSLRQDFAAIVGVKPPTLSKSIKEGRVPERWFGVMRKKFNVSKQDLLSTIDDIVEGQKVPGGSVDGQGVKNKTISNISYKASHNRQSDGSQQIVREGKNGQPYSKDDWHRRCSESFEVVFDWIAYRYGTDARAIERFKNKYLTTPLMNDPDFRQWLYSEDDEG